jgi:hypothetical protein
MLVTIPIHHPTSNPTPHPSHPTPTPPPSLGVTVLFYMLVSVLGYLALGDAVHDNVLLVGTAGMGRAAGKAGTPVRLQGARLQGQRPAGRKPRAPAAERPSTSTSTPTPTHHSPPPPPRPVPQSFKGAPAWVSTAANAMVLIHMVSAWQVYAQPVFQTIEDGFIAVRPTLQFATPAKEFLVRLTYR